jgi:hypothetical protein
LPKHALGSTEGKWNTANRRWWRIRKSKYCPALWSQASTEQLAIVLTHLRFTFNLIFVKISLYFPYLLVLNEII